MIPNNERWERLKACGVHDWQSLPVVDSGEHYCEHCSTLWDESGRMVNLPALRSGKGDVMTTAFWRPTTSVRFSATGFPDVAQNEI